MIILWINNQNYFAHFRMMIELEIEWICYNTKQCCEFEFLIFNLIKIGMQD